MTVLASELSGKMDYTRQRDFFDPSDYPNSKVTMVGCGGIGSFTAMALAKLGIQNFVLIDPDHVETHNLPNQMYERGYEGTAKVEALGEQLEAAGMPQNILLRTEMLSETPRSLFTGDIVISALDSMEARRELWETHIRGNANVKCFIDGRLGGFNIRVFTIDPTNDDDIAFYEGTLHTDDEASEESCTAKAIIDVGFQVAALITRQTRLFYGASTSSGSMRSPIKPAREVYFDQATLFSFQEG